MPFGFNFGIGDTTNITDVGGGTFQGDIDFGSTSFSETGVESDVPEDSTDLDTYLKYIERGVDFIGGLTDIAEDWGIIGEEEARNIENTRQRTESDVADWFDRTFGPAIANRTITTMIPWILGIGGVLALVWLARKSN